MWARVGNKLQTVFKTFFQITQEFLLIIFYPFAGIFQKVFEPIFKTQSKLTNANTILIVERWFNPNILHLFWKRYLEKKGFRVIIVNFPFQEGDFESSADKLSAYIAKHELQDFVLVGVSGGGLTALRYLQKYRGWKQIKRAITIGSPLGGTYLMWFLGIFASGRDLWLGSPLTEQIKRIKEVDKRKLFCIRASFDEMVPEWSSSISGTNIITIPVWGHNVLHMASIQTYETVAKLAE